MVGWPVSSAISPPVLKSPTSPPPTDGRWHYSLGEERFQQHKLSINFRPSLEMPSLAEVEAVVRLSGMMRATSAAILWSDDSPTFEIWVFQDKARYEECTSECLRCL